MRLDLADSSLQYQQPVITKEPVPPNIQDPPGYVLRLFVAGHSATTEKILQNLHESLERSLGYPYTLKVIDVLTNPEQAEIDQVSATPTLVKVWPHPIRRIVGNLDDMDKLLQRLAGK